MEGAKLNDAQLALAPLRRSKLNGVELRNADLKKADLRGCELEGADLTGAKLSEAKLMFAKMNRAEIGGGYLKHAYLNNAEMRDANLRGANLIAADLYCSDLSGANLQSAKLQDAFLVDAKLNGANLKDAQLDGAKMSGTELKNATIRNAHLRKSDLESANLESAIIDGADCSEANLADTRLHSASLKGTLLNKTNLKGADLRATNLENAELNHADMRGAQVTGVNFHHTDLSHARMHDINFENVDLSTSRLIATQIVNPQGGVFEDCKIRTTLFGLYKCPDNLPMHPISDVVGLQPDVKRKIADAQYLRQLASQNGFLWTPNGNSWHAVAWKGWAQENQQLLVGKPDDYDFWEWYAVGGPLVTLGEIFRHGFFRMWGIASCFGQSLKRWISWSAILALFFAMVFSGNLANAGHEFSLRGAEGQTIDAIPSLGEALYFSLVTFTTLGFGDITPTTSTGQFWVCLEVVFGYMMLGGLISIFSNKMTRLS